LIVCLTVEWLSLLLLLLLLLLVLLLLLWYAHNLWHCC
jgi:hypothetical protein